MDLNTDKKSNGTCISLYSPYEVIMSVNCELNNLCMLPSYFKTSSIYSVENQDDTPLNELGLFDLFQFISIQHKQ